MGFSRPFWEEIYTLTLCINTTFAFFTMVRYFLLRVVTLVVCVGFSCVAFARENASFRESFRIASNNHRSLAALGEACSSPIQCDGSGEQTCSSGKCVCNTGYYESDATTCTIVPAGFYQDEIGADGYITCAPGTYCPAGTSSPLTCPPGKYSLIKSSACTVTPAGSYTGTAGSGETTACPVGKYSAASATECTLCEAGKIAASTGSTTCTP